MAGEVRDPQRIVSRAIITAMFAGAAIYILLEISFIGALDPANLTHGWSKPLGLRRVRPTTRSHSRSAPVGWRSCC